MNLAEIIVTITIIIFIILSLFLIFILKTENNNNKDISSSISTYENREESIEEKALKRWRETYAAEAQRGNRADWRLAYLIREGPDAAAFDALLECVYRDKLDLHIESIKCRAAKEFSQTTIKTSNQ